MFYSFNITFYKMCLIAIHIKITEPELNLSLLGQGLIFPKKLSPRLQCMGQILRSVLIGGVFLPNLGKVQSSQ